jgi:hypothetical protein
LGQALRGAKEACSDDNQTAHSRNVDKLNYRTEPLRIPPPVICSDFVTETRNISIITALMLLSAPLKGLVKI